MIEPKTDFVQSVINPASPRRITPRLPYNLNESVVINLISEQGTSWKDYSKNALDFTINGPVWTDRGRWGPALYFDGINDNVLHLSNALMRGKDAFSFELWIYPYVVGGDTVNRNILNIGWNANGSLVMYFLSTTAGRINIEAKNDAATGISTYNLRCTPAYSWHQIVLTYTGAKITLYVDTFFNESKNATGSFNAATQWTLGDATNDYIGLIDTFRFYNRALTLPEVIALYEYGKV
jgi:hypothetical protein